MVKHERTHDDDRDRLRLARMPGHYTDEKVAGTMNAYRAMARGELKRDRVGTVAPDGETWSRNTREAIHTALRRSLIGPVILGHHCPTCDAPAGAYCVQVARGYCGQRVHLAIRTLAALDNLEGPR